MVYHHFPSKIAHGSDIPRLNTLQAAPGIPFLADQRPPSPPRLNTTCATRRNVEIWWKTVEIWWTYGGKLLKYGGNMVEIWGWVDLAMKLLYGIYGGINIQLYQLGITMVPFGCQGFDKITICWKSLFGGQNGENVIGDHDIYNGDIWYNHFF